MCWRGRANVVGRGLRFAWELSWALGIRVLGLVLMQLLLLLALLPVPRPLDSGEEMSPDKDKTLALAPLRAARLGR